MLPNNKNIFFKFSVLIAMSLVFLFLGNVLLAKSIHHSYQNQFAKLSSAKPTAETLTDYSYFCDDDDDDSVLQKRKVNLSNFENLSHSLSFNFSESSFSNKDFSHQFTIFKVSFHILHSNFRI